MTAKQGVNRSSDTKTGVETNTTNNETSNNVLIIAGKPTCRMYYLIEKEEKTNH